MMKVMAKGGSDNGNIKEISKRLSKVHLDFMDEEDNYVWVCSVNLCQRNQV